MQEYVKEEIVQLLPKLRRFALALTGCPDRGEDLVQDTCAKAIARASQWRKGTRLDSWLYRIAQNHWIDTIRAGRHVDDAVRVEDLAVPDRQSGGDSVFARQHDLAVRAAVGSLPVEQRAVVALVCVEGLAYREAAEVLGIPIGTVMSRLARARRSLHSKLYGDEEPGEGRGNGHG